MVFYSTLEDPTFSQSSERWKAAKQQISEVLQGTSEDNFDAFATKLMKTLEKRFFSTISTVTRSRSVLREKMWTTFHQLRLSELPLIWTEFFPNMSSLVCQQVSYKLYADLAKINLSQGQGIKPPSTEIPELTLDEENIIRYAAGYVPFKLLKKYEKSKEVDFALSVIECLLTMSVNGDESDLMEYTRKWCLEIDRGGLFEINDITYALFKEIEMNVRCHLFTAFRRKSGDKSEDDRTAIIKAVASNDDVAFYWTMVSIDISNESYAIRLLEEIIGLWVTIRGFSIAGCWLEKYKQKNKASVSKSKALRKELKQKSSDASTSS